MGTVTLGPYFSEPITMTVTLKICQKEKALRTNTEKQLGCCS